MIDNSPKIQIAFRHRLNHKLQDSDTLKHPYLPSERFPEALQRYVETTK